MYDPSGDTLSLFSLESQASAAPSVYTKYSKGSKWSHAKPEPLSTDVTPTKKDQSSNTPTVEKTSQATQYDVPNTTQDLIEGVEQEQPVTLHSASYIPVPRPQLSLFTVTPVPSVHLSSPLEVIRATNQPAVGDNHLAFVPSLQQDVDEGVAQEPVSTATQASTPHGIPTSLQSEAERDRAQQPSSTVPQPSIYASQHAEESMSQVMWQFPSPSRLDPELQYNQPGESENNQASSTATQAYIQADQPADANFSLTSARQPDSSHLLQSTDVQQPADMSASLNDQQGANQPSSTIPPQSLEDAQQPHDDMGSM